MNLFCEAEVNWRGGEVYNRAMGITLRTFRERIMWLLDRPEHGNGISQKELAAAMGISSQYLSTLIRKESPRRPNVRHLQAAAGALNTSVSFLALATDDPSPDKEDAGPIYFSPQADEAAQLIDAMPTDTQRELALQLVRQVAAYVGVERELVPVTERKNNPAQIESVPGAMGARWILGDKSGR
jgi:transcriptional regulator with XRE-family HTH domain